MRLIINFKIMDLRLVSHILRVRTMTAYIKAILFIHYFIYSSNVCKDVHICINILSPSRVFIQNNS